MDYNSIGIDSRMRSITALPNRPRNKSEYELSQLNYVNASKVNLGEFIKEAVGGSALGTFSSSQALTLDSNITYAQPKSSNRTFGKPLIGIYQGSGTAAADQIYPVIGANVTVGRYDVVGGDNDYSSYNGTADNWRATIVDTNGTSTQVITFVANWLFVDYLTDTVS